MLRKLLVTSMASAIALVAISLWAGDVGAAPPERVDICHISPSNPDNRRVITASGQSVAKHIYEHGDALYADPEVCDGGDNDCDGLVDNGFYVGDTCAVGLGVCERTGFKVCTQDGTGTTCDQAPGGPTESLETTCADGLDNDCDGFVDDADGDCLCPCFNSADVDALVEQCRAGSIPEFPQFDELRCRDIARDDPDFNADIACGESGTLNYLVLVRADIDEQGDIAGCFKSGEGNMDISSDEARACRDLLRAKFEQDVCDVGP
jgi:hypothetical protein